jgi:hypothetical protein
MTEPDGMYGEDVRHALSAVADLVVPAGDGLAKIRQRTSHRPPAFAWLYAYGSYLPRVVIVLFRVPASELVLMAKGQSTLPKRLWARLRGQLKPGSPHAWLRPALAAAGALLMVVAITLAVPGLRQTVTTSALNSSSTNSSSPGGNSSLGSEQASGASRGLPTSSGSGMNLTVPPVGILSSACATQGSSHPSSSSSGSTYIPPVGSSPTESAGVNGSNIIAPSQSDTTLHNGAKSQTGTARCPRSRSTSPSSSSSPPTSSPPPTTTPPPTTSPPISPSGGGTPTPTGTAITDSPSPSDSDTGGMAP